MRRLAAAIAGLAAVAAAGPATAGAAVGTTVLELSGSASDELRDAGVSVQATGGGAKRLRLPVTGGDVGTIARLDLGGTITFRAAQKRVRVHRLRGTLSEVGSQINGSIGGTQFTILRLRGVEIGDYDPLTGEVAVDGAGARLGGTARSELQRRLGGARLPAKLGAARIDAQLEAAPSQQSEPPVLERPAGAVDIASAELTWRARESWVDYLHAAGDQGGSAVSGGATDGPAEVIPPSSQARVYEFGFPFANGWFDPATGFAASNFMGTVNFHKLIDPFQIDLDSSNPEIELTGESSRAVFTLNGRRNNADQQNRRAVVVDLDPVAAPPSVTTAPDGSATYTYDRIPATVPEGPTAWPIASFYTPGSAWGSVSISFTVPGTAP